MKNVLNLAFFLLLTFSLNVPMAFGQQLLNGAFASPKAITGQTIGLTDVTVTYYRPAVKDREIWGKLVPYNNVWRTGANYNTVISFSDDVTIEGKDLTAGTYSIHMIPTEEKWEVIFNKNTTAWGSFAYNPTDDALRVEVKPQRSESFQEQLAFVFDKVNNESAVCALKWEKLSVPFTIGVDAHNTILTSYRDQLQTKAGWSWQGWHEAANYCVQNDVNHQEGLAWATRSVFMQPTPQNLVTKARLTAKVKGEGNEEKEMKYFYSSLEKDLETHPCTWKEYNAAANLAIQKENYEKALAWSKKSVEMSPNMTNMMAHATVLEKTGDAKAASRVKEKAIAEGSNGELNNYGYQLLQSGKTAEAVKVFLVNAEKHPEDPNVWDSLGEGYLNNGQNEKAIKAFKKSLSLNPPANVKANSMKLLKQLGVEYKADKTKP